MSTRNLAVFLATLLGTSYVTSVAVAAEFLTGNEVKKLVVGSTIHAETASGAKFRAYFDPKGKVTRKENDQVMEGVWRVKDKGALCVRFGDKEERCGAVKKNSDGTYTRVDDTKATFHWIKVSKGKDS